MHIGGSDDSHWRKVVPTVIRVCTSVIARYRKRSKLHDREVLPAELCENGIADKVAEGFCSLRERC